MKLVINKCYGGFELSHAAIMRYAKLKGIKLFAFTEEYPTNYNNRKFLEYKGQESFCIHYSTKPLKDGKHEEDSYFSTYDFKRNDPILIQVVEEMGTKANGRCAKLEIIEIPDGTEWQIEEYDGSEWVSEVHKTWS